MGVARVASRAQLGLSAPRVEVEVHLGQGLPHVLHRRAARHGGEGEQGPRARRARRTPGFEFPAGRITVNLSPADLPKEGCRYDLADRARHPAGLVAARLAMRSGSTSWEFYGELGLAGELKPIKGMLLAAAHAARAGAWHRGAGGQPRRGAPRRADRGARRARRLLEVCASARQCVRDARGDEAGEKITRRIRARASKRPISPTCAARRRRSARCVVAAAGGHSLLLVGPPGTGKSMLAQRLPGLLPPLEGIEALDVAAIASVSASRFRCARLRPRPFRAPHHTASASAIIGGGSQRAAPAR